MPIFHDNFDRSNEDLDASANWTQIGNWSDPQIVSNVVVGKVASAEHGCYHPTSMGTGDQFAQIDVGASGNVSVFVKCDGGADPDMYLLYVDTGGDARFYIVTDGSFDQKVVDSVTDYRGKTIRLTYESGTLKTYLDGVHKSGMDWSDSTFGSNEYCGVHIYDDTGSGENLDNFVCGSYPAEFTIKPSGGIFSTVATFLSSGMVFGTSDLTDTGDISGTWSADDTSAVTWNKAVKIRNSGSKNTNGYPGRSGGSYRLVIASGHVFTCTADVDIHDLDVMSDSTTTSDEIFRVSNGSDVIAKRCHLGFSGTTAEQDILYYATASSVTFDFESCMFFDAGRALIDIFRPGTCTITVNLNECSGYNIGGDYLARGFGSWVGAENLSGDLTLNVNVFACLLQSGFNTGNDRVFGIDSGSWITGTLNVDDCLTNAKSGNQADGFYNSDWASETVNIGGTGYEYIWTDGTPSTGDYVALDDITTSPYQQTLQDHADNDAYEYHSNATGSNSGLSHGTDIVGSVRGSPYCCGAHDLIVLSDFYGDDNWVSFRVYQEIS